MMGMRMPETSWAVFKWQVINLRSCCIWLVDSVEKKRYLPVSTTSKSLRQLLLNFRSCSNSWITFPAEVTVSTWNITDITRKWHQARIEGPVHELETRYKIFTLRLIFITVHWFCTQMGHKSRQENWRVSIWKRNFALLIARLSASDTLT
jgi:hypothetical protein